MKNGIKLAALSLFLIGSICPAIRAQDDIKPAKRALIKELFIATKVDKLAENFTNALLTQMERDLPKMVSDLAELGELQGRGETAESQRAIVEFRTRTLRRFKELIPQRINFAEVVEQMFYPLYDKFFTEDELKDLVAFYKSPTGQKSIGVMPQLLQDALQRSSEALNPKVMQIASEVISEERQRLKATGATKK